MKMLYKSGHNLKEGAIKFIKKSKFVTLFSAYLKLAELKSINKEHNITQIIVRWEIQDLCLGVSDIELYSYCKENNIALFRNTRLHLKAFWDNKSKLFFGSANVTGRGLGEIGQYNYELNGKIKNISFDDRAYLQGIVNDSEFVNHELFLRLKDVVDSTNLPTLKFPSIPTEKKEVDSFLMSQLPMSIPASSLYNYYSGKKIEAEDVYYAIHDISLYNIPLGLSKSEFYKRLKQGFNNHKFVLALKEYICSQPSKSLRYGGVVSWIQNNTTSVPIPRSWELKRDLIVNILYDWICYFDDDFKWDIPSYSQVIYCQSI